MIQETFLYNSHHTKKQPILLKTESDTKRPANSGQFGENTALLSIIPFNPDLIAFSKTPLFPQIPYLCGLFVKFPCRARRAA